MVYDTPLRALTQNPANGRLHKGPEGWGSLPDPPRSSGTSYPKDLERRGSTRPSKGVWSRTVETRRHTQYPTVDRASTSKTPENVLGSGTKEKDKLTSADHRTGPHENQDTRPPAPRGTPDPRVGILLQCLGEGKGPHPGPGSNRTSRLLPGSFESSG